MEAVIVLLGTALCLACVGWWRAVEALEDLDDEMSVFDRLLCDHLEECRERWDREAEMEAQELAERAPRRIGR